jgi:hypothetical protein
VDQGRYEVAEVLVRARHVAGVRARVARGRVAQEFGAHLDLVYAAARAGAVALDGRNVFIYRGATPEDLSVDFCVGVTAPFKAHESVVPLKTPDGVAAMTTHVGDYRGLPAAHSAILAWCRARARVGRCVVGSVRALAGRSCVAPHGGVLLVAVSRCVPGRADLVPPRRGVGAHGAG